MGTETLRAGTGPTERTDRFRGAVRLTRLLAALAATAGAVTFADPGVLQGPDVMVGSARGTGLILAVLGAPALAGSAELARRGADRALPVWLGAAGYVSYNAVLLLFGTPANPLLLLYTTVLGLSIATLVSVPLAAAPLLPARRGLRPYAVVLWSVSGINLCLWLAKVVPGLAQRPPDYLLGTGLTTNPIFVQDLAVWLPLAGLAGWWLWRGSGAGYLAGGAFLAGWVPESVTVTVDQWLGGHADPDSAVASASATVPFLILALIQVVVLVTFLRSSEP